MSQYWMTVAILLPIIGGILVKVIPFPNQKIMKIYLECVMVVTSLLFFLNLFSPENAIFLRENPMYMIYANIPPRIFAGEVFFITLFGIFSALFASARASREVLNLTVSRAHC